MKFSYYELFLTTLNFMIMISLNIYFININIKRSIFVTDLNEIMSNNQQVISIYQNIKKNFKIILQEYAMKKKKISLNF